MPRKTPRADKAWEDLDYQGSMSWLRDRTFVGPDCFLPPNKYKRDPRRWKRIAVCPATSSSIKGCIYKRVPGRNPDTLCNIAAAELASEGFGRRKRAKLERKQSACGLPIFDTKYMPAGMVGRNDIVTARDQVKKAYKQIAFENQILRQNALLQTRPYFDPSKLIFTPRKLHNTGWPLRPATWEVMIAECQPLIVFEIDINAIVEPAYVSQEDPEEVLKQKRKELARILRRRIKKCHSLVRRLELLERLKRHHFLSPIPEESSVGLPVKYRPLYSAPSKRWTAAADKYFTMRATVPGVVASDANGDKDGGEPPGIEITNHRGHFRVPSPSLSSRSAPTAASDHGAEDKPIEITNHRGHFRVPSPSLSSRSAPTAASDHGAEDKPIEITNHRGHFRVPSPSLTSGSATTAASKRNTEDPIEVTNERGRFRVPSPSLSSRSASTGATDRKRKAQNDKIDQRPPTRRRSMPCAQTPCVSNPTDLADVAVFQQPMPNVQTEPEHETRRRLSLNNARRSDRNAQMTIFKKVSNWVARTFIGTRRSHEEAMGEQGEQNQLGQRPPKRRRHSLDVDVGRNPDIFGQSAGHDGAIPIVRKAGNLAAAQDDSLSDMGSEFSMVQTARAKLTAAPLKTPATHPVQKTTSINWNAIQNIDDEIRDLLDRKADEVFNRMTNGDGTEPLGQIIEAGQLYSKNIAAGINDGSTALKDEDNTQPSDQVFSKDMATGNDGEEDVIVKDEEDTLPLDQRVIDRLESVLKPDEDEDMTFQGPDFNTIAPQLQFQFANLPTADPSTADSNVADSPALDSSVPDSQMPDLSTATEASVEITPNTATADRHVSRELAAMPQSAEASEHDPIHTLPESATITHTPISDKLEAMSQPLEASNESHTATVIAPTCTNGTLTPQELEAPSQPLEISNESHIAITIIAPTCTNGTPTPQELEAPSQPLEASNGDIHDAIAIPPTSTGSTSNAGGPTVMSQPAHTPEQNLDSAIPAKSVPEQPSASPQSMPTIEPGAGPITMPTTQSQSIEAENGESNDDSQFEILHQFVRRAQMKPKPNEPTTFATGSPRASGEISIAVKSPRKPLGIKDSNLSPSPKKKRKLKEAEEAPLDMSKNSRLVKPDLDDATPQPLRKRRRKGAEDDSPDEIFNPEMAMSQSLTSKGVSGGPRRSKRVATTKRAEPATPSHIPVRLPGSYDADMPAISTAGLMQRKEEKDLAMLTRTNTRRNKGAALPVPARLAGLGLPADNVAGDDPFVSPTKAAGGRASRRGKAVRWDETLARSQVDDVGKPLAAASAAAPAAPAAEAKAAAEAEDPTTSGPAPAAAPAESEKKKALRPRPSRLPAAVTKTPRASRATRANSAPPTPTPTRRARKLGARLGTPAAKRRGSTRD